MSGQPNNPNIDDNYARINFEESDKICPFEGEGYVLYQVSRIASTSNVRPRGPPSEMKYTYVCLSCGFEAVFISTSVLAKYQSENPGAIK